MMTSSSEYDVIIVGSGPAGLFAAYTLIKEQLDSKEYKIAIIEQGNEMDERICPAIKDKCINCKYCNLISGGGGAGLFSDGKLILDLNAGGHLESIISDNFLKSELAKFVEDTLRKFDGKSEEQRFEPPILDKYKFCAKELGINYKYYHVRHMGSYNLKAITNRFVKFITSSRKVDIFYNTRALDFISSEGSYLLDCESIINNSRISFKAKNIIFAVGKIGSSWLESILSIKNCTFDPNQCYFGLRLETKAENLKNIFDDFMDPKLSKKYPTNVKLKTHCYCKNGEVILLKYDRLALVGGHTIYTSNNLNVDLPINSGKSNLNILMSIDTDPLAILYKFNSYSNGRLVVQKLGDFENNTISTNFGSIIPNNINNVLFGNIRELTKNVNHFSEFFLDFLKRLNELTPGINNAENLLYGPVIEWWMKKVKVNSHMETSLPGIFAVGDGAGLSQGIVHSAATGILAARCIKSRLQVEEDLVIDKITT